MTELLTITDRAAAKAKVLLEKTGKPDAAMRIRVISGGCSGMEYKIEPAFGPPEPTDKVVEAKGVRLYLDAKGLLYIAGTEMDYISALSGSRFKFNNPNAVAECACGDSFTA